MAVLQLTLTQGPGLSREFQTQTAQRAFQEKGITVQSTEHHEKECTWTARGQRSKQELYTVLTNKNSV
jgi:hypothetical protein